MESRRHALHPFPQGHRGEIPLPSDLCHRESRENDRFHRVKNNIDGINLAREDIIGKHSLTGLTFPTLCEINRKNGKALDRLNLTIPAGLGQGEVVARTRCTNAALENPIIGDFHFLGILARMNS